MCESELEKRLDELLDELLQTKDETKKSALRKKIEPIFEELNRDDRPKKCDPFWLTDNCDTISCLEIDMKHDRRGRIKGWMEGGLISDVWDGLNDNQLRVLEDMDPARRSKYRSEL